MKLIHLSDLHIGKKLNEFSLLEDQKYILTQILELIRQEKPDGVIIAGDVYDKAIPSVEAVQLLDSFLTELAETDQPVFIISGNHDSAERLTFGSKLFSRSNIHVAGIYDGTVPHFTLTDTYGKVNIHLLPFIKPSAVRRIFEEATVSNFNEALQTVLEHMQVNTVERNVLVAHQFVTGALRSDSEEIFVGGLDNVDATLFKDFDYTALGHIHSPQNIGSEKIRYCGTPLKYSFSEAAQEKSLTVVELKEKGELNIRCLSLKPLHDLKKLKGTYMQLASLDFYKNLNRSDYYHITLTDEDDVLDAVKKLRTIYPNLMQLEYDNHRTRSAGEIIVTEKTVQKSELELFQEFFELQNNTPMNNNQQELVKELLDALKSS